VLVQQKEPNSKLKNKMEKEDKEKEEKKKIPKQQKEKSAGQKEEENLKKSETDKGKKEEKKTGKKAKEKKSKKTEVLINAKNLPISTKDSASICKFIKNKKIEEAIADLEQVIIFKKSVPMKGEIPHRKGPGIMSGRFPKNAAQKFIKLLKSLSANAAYNGLENPVIAGAVANIGERPYGKFGWVRKKRTHIKLKVKDVKKK